MSSPTLLCLADPTQRQPDEQAAVCQPEQPEGLPLGWLPSRTAVPVLAGEEQRCTLQVTAQQINTLEELWKDAQLPEELCSGRDLGVGLHLSQAAGPQGGGGRGHQASAPQALHCPGLARPQPLPGVCDEDRPTAPPQSVPGTSRHCGPPPGQSGQRRAGAPEAAGAEG